MRRRAVIPALLAAAAPSFASETDAIASAQAAALAWLALVDAGDARSSWQQASVGLRAALTVEQWSQAVGAARAPLGALARRTQASARFTMLLPGVPDGQHVLLQYDAAFAHKGAAVETVTVTLDPDGAWRVAGYFIR